MEKSELRKLVIARRNTMDPALRQEKSQEICRRVYSRVAQGMEGGRPANGACPVVGVYSALGSEVNLEHFEKNAWAAGWKLAYPCMVKNTGESDQHMEFYLVPEDKAQRKDAGFLAHPARVFADDDPGLQGCVHVTPGDLDVLVVPMVAFTSEFFRMGYGGGNYDRYLLQLREGALVVGAAFQEQLQEDIPLEPHDLQLPLIVSA